MAYSARRASSIRRSIFLERDGILTEEQLHRRELHKFIFSVVKIAILLIIWAICTVYIILTPPHKSEEIIVPLHPNAKQVVEIDEDPLGDSVSVELKGNIDLIATMHSKFARDNPSAIDVAIELFNDKSNESSWISRVWKVYVAEADSTELNTVKKRFKLDDDLRRAFISDLMMDKGMVIRAWSNPDTTLQLTLLSHHTEPLGMSIKIDANPFNESLSVWLGLLLLIMLYVLIGFDITDRTFAALMAATSGIGVLCILEDRPSLQEIVQWIDMETLMLLFGMMIMVSIVSETGAFDYLTVFAYELSKGHIWRLLFYLYMFTGVLSAFLDNVTIVLLMVPVTIRLCEMLAINTLVVLICVAIFSNIGGTLTPVGDPPNVIIVSNSFIHQSGINFGNFVLHVFPGVLVAMLLGFVLIYYMTRDKLKDTGDQLLRSIAALEKQAENSKDTQYSHTIHRHIEVLRERLEMEKTQQPKSEEHFEETLKHLKENQRIKDMPLLIKCCIALGIAVFLFLLSSIPGLKGIMLSWSAILAALLLLILANRSDVDSILERVEWSTLVFFAALFVFMESLVVMGLIDCINDITTDIIMGVDEDSQMVVSILLVLWFSALSSAFVDNIPITTLMLKLVIKLGTNKSLGLSLHPLIWSLVYGACFGGNGTLIGASANVVTCGIAKQHGYDINFRHFLYIGFPVMIFTVIIATIYLLIAHCLFTWH
ncbi:P protein-like [Drosophila sulfurigaster albostrigata]|uniref:P protein-like n=1 Tax=Drosophila sulfurigaster albostrigata TaxID=89887 RepID=UPI002D219DD5|nr:P protein-like [Drosophila sulfurigaster albostrigata]